MVSSFPRKKIKHSSRHLRIIISQQRLEIVDEKNNALHISYPISSSRFGLGTEPGSLRTPLGKFIIEEKIGAGAPERMIFKGRQPTGVIAPLGGDEDHVLTRILWLGGCDDDNANTRDRFIYIHGTNQEDRLGSPASHGCIRLSNADMISLFDAVEEGDRVEIIL